MFSNGNRKAKDVVEENRALRARLHEQEKKLFEKLANGEPEDVQKLAKRMLKMLAEAHS